MTPQYTPDALRDIAAFLPVFEAPDFRFAHNDSPLRQTGEKRYEVVGYDYDPQVWKLLDVLSQHGWLGADWTRGKERVRSPRSAEALAQATPQQLDHLLTTFARMERFSDGAMLSFWQSGFLLGILRRAAALAAEAGAGA